MSCEFHVGSYFWFIKKTREKLGFLSKRTNSTFKKLKHKNQLNEILKRRFLNLTKAKELVKRNPEYLDTIQV